jgi:predicted dehydrogenase
VDFLEKKTEIVRMKSVEGEADPFAMVIDLPEGKGQKEIIFDRPDIDETNPIRDELEALADAIENNTDPVVTAEDGARALDVAHQILQKMKFGTPSIEEA